MVAFEEPRDPDEFERHFWDVHIPVAKEMPGLRRYTVSRNVAPVRGDAFFQISELDWADMGALEQAFQSSAGRATAHDVAELAPADGVRSVVYDVEDVAL